MKRGLRCIGVLALFVIIGLPAPRSLAALPSGNCDAARVPVASPFGTTRCQDVQPGGMLSMEPGPFTGTECTLNFLFRGSDGNRYIGTAGRCLLLIPAESKGEKKWRFPSGPYAYNALSFRDEGKIFGRAVYAVYDASKHLDFGLVRAYPHVKTRADMCHFGGPVGIDTARIAEPVQLEYYGNGIGIEAVTRARTGMAPNTSDAAYVDALGLAVYGDAGSPVTRDGKALGVISSYGPTDGSAVFLATRVAPQLARAEKALGLKLKLQTARRL